MKANITFVLYCLNNSATKQVIISVSRVYRGIILYGYPVQVHVLQAYCQGTSDADSTSALCIVTCQKKYRCQGCTVARATKF